MTTKRASQQYFLNLILFICAILVLLPALALSVVIMDEHFEGGLPAGWSVIDNAGTGVVWSFDDPCAFGNSTGGSGLFALVDGQMCYLGISVNTEMRTPVIDMSNTSSVTLEFKTYIEGNRYGDFSNVDISINGAAGPWTNVWAKKVDTWPPIYGPSTETVDIASIAAGQSIVMIRFHDAVNNRTWQVDDVKINGTISLTVTPSVGANGSISPATPQMVDVNATASFTITPDAGYYINSATGCGGTLSVHTYTTGPVTADCTVTAAFTPLPTDIYKFERLWPTLQQPWYFFNPTSIAYDSSGFLYVLDSGNSLIKKYTLDGQLITEWPGSGLDIASDSEGYVYVANASSIQKFTSNGQLLISWGSAGSEDGQFNVPNGLAVDSSGFVYVVDSGNMRIQKFDSEGVFKTKWGSSGSGDGQFSNLSGIAVDSSGFVYVIDAGNIQKFTSNGQFVSKWVGFSSTDIAIDSEGYIYLSSGIYTINKLTSNGQLVKTWGSGCWLISYSQNCIDPDGSGPMEKGDGQSWYIKGIAVDSNGFVYVSDRNNHRVQKFTSDGQFVNKWASTGRGEGKFYRPKGIATDNNGYVYVADMGNYRVQKFTPDGLFIKQWGSPGDGDGQFDSVLTMGIAVDSIGDVYVTDYMNQRVQKFTADGDYLSQWYTGYGWGIAIDSNDYVYVSGEGIQKFTSDGQLVASWAGGGRGIAVDSNGYVYVSDAANNIYKFTSDGQLVISWGSNGYGQGIGVDNNGFIYVPDGIGSIQKFTSDGQLVASFGGIGAGPQMFNRPEYLSIHDDKIYITDSYNHRIQVIKQVSVSSNNKAIVVAGGGPYAGNKLWEATQTAANFAYITLNYQGFPNDSIYYLTADANIDIDGNGTPDRDGDANVANLQNAITTWASDADNLFVYLVDHGGSGTFRMSGTETLSALQLDTWLDAVQASMPGKVTVIYDACESGSFLSALTPPSGKERILVTSTSSGEISYFVNQGSVSFSNFFWTNVFNGSNVKEAFDNATSALTTAITNQTPQLEDGTVDDSLAAATYIGNGTIIYGNIPTIGSVSATAPTQSSSTLTANNVTDSDGIARVWAVILPPNYASGTSNNSVNGLPSINLMPTATQGQYQATYDKFNIAGTYNIAIYAKDRIGNTSMPSTTTVTVNNPLRRKAIIVTGGSQTDTNWSGIQKGAQAAYDALKFQGYSNDDIYFTSPVTFTTGIDGTSTLSNLNYAITSWANNSSAQDVVLYMIGNGDSETFHINSTEALFANNDSSNYDLDTWLDTLQGTITGKVTVIYDASLSGGFITALAPPSGKERILISSTGSNGSACFLSDGDISFSRYFWTRILNGANVRDAFFHAQDALSISCGQQVAQIDDNGNGVTNEQGDGAKAFNYTIGTGIRLAGADPLIGSVISDQEIWGSDLPVMIWAQDVTTTGTLQEVWAIITPPGHSSTVLPNEPVTNLEKVTLTYNSSTARHEGTTSSFSKAGRYKVTIYAKDSDGNISTVEERTFTRVDMADSYEEDDSYDQANIIVVNGEDPQQHNFYDGDADWVKFYGVDDVSYEFKATNVGSNNDVAIELYGSDGITLILPSPWNDPGGTGKGESHSWICCPGDQSGFFYVKVLNALGLSGEGTEYDFAVNDTIGPGEGQLSGRVTISGTTQGINNALVQTLSGSTVVRQTTTNSVGIYSMSHPVGSYSIGITKSPYTLIAYTPVGNSFQIASATDIEDKSAQMAQCTDNDSDTFTTCNGDCNDGNPAINQNTWWYLDSDGDGYGTASAAMQQCAQPAGYVLNSTDCGDSDANIYPGGPDVRIVSPLAYYSISQFQAVYDVAGSGATIQSKVATYTGSFTAGQSKIVTIKGGYDCSFTTNSGTTIINNGNMTINSGTVTIEGIKVQ
jgi:hypothetical protein